MFRNLNLKNNKYKIKFYLYKNFRDRIAEIPLNCIGDINFNSFDEIDNFNIKVNKFETINGENRELLLFKTIQARHQVVAIYYDEANIEVERERYILYSPKLTTIKNQSVKSFVAYRFEKTLEETLITFDNSRIQLKSNSENTSKGFLDLFTEKIDNSWTIRNVDIDAMKKTIPTLQRTSQPLYPTVKKYNIKVDDILFESVVNVPTVSGKPISINFIWEGVTTTSSIDGVVSLNNIEIRNTIDEKFYQGLIRVKATYISTSKHSYGIRYEFTYIDGKTITKDCDFTYLEGMNLTTGKVSMEFDYGEIVDMYSLQYIDVTDQSSNALTILREVLKMFEAIPIFDTINNIIDIVAIKNLPKDIGVLLSLQSNIIESNISESDEVVTALKVIGKDGLSIAEVNKFGGDKIYDYSYFINSNKIDEETKVALQKYNTILDREQTKYTNFRNLYLVSYDKYLIYYTEFVTLENRLKREQEILSVMHKNKENTLTIKTQLDLINQIKRRMVELNNFIKVEETNMKNYLNQMNMISVFIDRKNVKWSDGSKIFTDDMLRILRESECVKEYNNDYITQVDQLLNYSYKVLQDKLKPLKTFELNVSDFLNKFKHNRGWRYILNRGNSFKLEDEEIINALGQNNCLLVGYTLKRNSDNLFTVSNLRFSNKLFSDDLLTTRLKSKYGAMTTKIQSITAKYSRSWQENKDNHSFINNILNQGIDLDLGLKGTNIQGDMVEIGLKGIYISDGVNSNNQIAFMGSSVLFTNNGWETSDVAIDSTGVIAEKLVGNLILGNKLQIQGDNGNISIGEFIKTGMMGVKVIDTGIKVIDNEGNEKIFLGTTKTGGSVGGATSGTPTLRMIGTNSNQVVFSDAGLMDSDQFALSDNLDSTHPMVLPFYSDSDYQYYTNVILTIYNTRYRATESGSSSGGDVTSGSSSKTSSESGGGSTSSSDGEHRHLVLKKSAGDIITSAPQGYTKFDYANSLAGYYNVALPFFVFGGGALEDIYTYSANGSHNHTISAHTHNIAHTHSIPPHTHDLVYKIYESTKCTNMKVSVNGTEVATGLNGDTIEVNITQYIQIGKLNLIEISSTTNGRIVANLFAKGMRKW